MKSSKIHSLNYKSEVFCKPQPNYRISNAAKVHIENAEKGGELLFPGKTPLNVQPLRNSWYFLFFAVKFVDKSERTTQMVISQEQKLFGASLRHMAGQSKAHILFHLLAPPLLGILMP